MGDCSDYSDSCSTASTSEQDEAIPQTSRKKTSAVLLSRFVIAAVMLATTAAVGVTTFKLASRMEQNDFAIQYESASSEIIRTVHERMSHFFSDLKMLSQTTTSFAKHENATWPFVTLPDFEERSRSVRESSVASSIALVPLVSDSERMQWQDYSQNKLGSSYHKGGESMQVASGDIWNYADDNIDCRAKKRQQGRMVESVQLGSGPYAPLWQISTTLPSGNTSAINYNTLQEPSIAKAVSMLIYTREPALVDICYLPDWISVNEMANALHLAALFPVFDGFDNTSSIVGFFIASLDLEGLFSVPDSVAETLSVMLKDSCHENSVYTTGDPNLEAAAVKDHLHPSREKKAPLMRIHESNLNQTVSGRDDSCAYSIHIFATEAFQHKYETNTPMLFTAGITLAFIFIFILFLLYDFIIQRHQLRVVKAVAEKHEGLVSSLFPENVRKQVLSQAAGYDGSVPGKMDASDAPIADLYLDCSVLFADLAGFTAWSSTREPAQVFILLETVYSAFDELAKQRGVFKIETVGDCYVAVTGLPRPRKDHAIVMARFARDCVSKMQLLVHQLEKSLGPDTADLAIRCGIHSGAVTAGVLRGDKARFQLFGDTVNTASRIESSGMPNRIQLSEDTANLLVAAGKQHWIEPRQEVVEAKGKGQLQTFWLVMNRDSDTLSTTSSDKVKADATYKTGSTATLHKAFRDDELKMSLKRSRSDRLIEWNCDVLLRLLKQVIARRYVLLKRNPKRKADADESQLIEPETHVIEEVREIIEVPNHRVGELDYESIVLPKAVVDEMYDYVANIAAMYHDNPFHNFEHASHVAMSVTKLLSRIVAPPESECVSKTLHDHTYGITSDPLTQFACVFSALIHDVDHPGVPNAQLVVERTTLADFYKGKSVAEQNSVDLAWGLLMDERYANLRRSIYTTKKGLERFRQMVVNSVMATDIVDKDLKELRNARWAKAFSGSVDESKEDDRNRKATIVIEHLIQASDVAHTMQHWHVYRKWNERFFQECYQAYIDGRALANPSANWYEGEIGFFDFYIIPLAKKLKECGVFGKSSDEYLTYAETNRKEWELKGREVVEEMVSRVSGHAHINSNDKQTDLVSNAAA